MCVNFAKINTPPWVFFPFFKLYKQYQITQRITNIDKRLIISEIQKKRIKPRSLHKVKLSKNSFKLNLRTTFILLKIGYTLPVSSVGCEQSFSVMRKLRNWMRSGMPMERLSSLAIGKIHFGRQINSEEAVKFFLSLHTKISKSEESDI